MHVYINAVEKSRTARSDKNTNSCPETLNKTVTGYKFYHASEILQTNKKTGKKSISTTEVWVDGLVYLWTKIRHQQQPG